MTGACRVETFVHGVQVEQSVYEKPTMTSVVTQGHTQEKDRSKVGKEGENEVET